MRRKNSVRGRIRVNGKRCLFQEKYTAKMTKTCHRGVDAEINTRYNNDSYLGFATVLRFSPHFEKWSPGLQCRYVKPPSKTPGDGRYGRQGTSLLHIAGEKTRTSAPWVPKASVKRRLFCFFNDYRCRLFLWRREGPKGNRKPSVPGHYACFWMSESWL